MTERPILFSAPMVRALLAGAKTQTRRVVKPQPAADLNWVGWCLTSTHTADEGKATWARGEGPHLVDTHRVRCPYGQPGDRLWLRETFFAWGRWETRYSAEKGRDEWHFVDMTAECGQSYLYAADGVRITQAFIKRRGGVTPMYWKRPSIHMPRAASRITLEVTGVRVERLQDISEADALAEGIAYSERFNGYRIGYAEYFKSHDPRRSYFSLWETINGAGSVDANPWVWAIEFTRLEQAA